MYSPALLVKRYVPNSAPLPSIGILFGSPVKYCFSDDESGDGIVVAATIVACVSFGSYYLIVLPYTTEFNAEKTVQYYSLLRE